MSGGTSEERTDLFGNKYIQHYDEHGNKTGTSEKRTGLFGDTYTQHYDKYGSKAGTSEQRTGLFGDTYTQHYDKYGSKSGTSEQRTGLFGDTYTQHYDKYGSKSGTSEKRTGIFGDTYTQHYGSYGGYSSSSSNGYSSSSSYSTSYSNPYASTYSAPAPVVKVPNMNDMKLMSSKSTYSANEMSKIKTVHLKKEDEDLFLWYAAQLLMQKSVPFTTTKLGERMWEIYASEEYYDSREADKDEYEHSYLSEHGLGWGHHKVASSYRGFNYENDYPFKKPSLQFVDAFLKRKGIDFGTDKFSKLGVSERKEIENEYKSASDKIVKVKKKIQFAIGSSSFVESNKENYLNSESISLWLMLLGWVLFSAVTLFGSKMDFFRYMDPGLIMCGVNFMVGSWLLTRPGEYAIPATRLSAFFFTSGMSTLGFVYHVPGTIIAVIVAIGIFFSSIFVKRQISSGILVAVVSVLAAVAENLVFYNIHENIVWLLWAVYGVAAIISIVGLVNIIDFFVLRANGKTRVKFKTMEVTRSYETFVFRKMLWCLVAGAAIVAVIFVLPFVDNLYVCIVAYAMMLIAGIVLVDYRYTITNMARNLIMLPTTICLLLGLIGCNFKGSHIADTLADIGCEWIVKFFDKLGDICMRVTTVLYTPYQMAMDFLAKDYISSSGKFTSKDVETLYTIGSGMTTGFTILGIFLLVFVVCSLGAIIGAARTKSKTKK